LGKSGQVERGAKLPDEARSVPRCPASQLASLQQRYVRGTAFGQMVRNTGPHNATTDDDDLDLRRNFLSHVHPLLPPLLAPQFTPFVKISHLFSPL
jgi:hypothetical protein